MFYAPDKETIQEHARRVCFPVSNIQEIKATIDPTTSESLDKLQAM